MLHYVQNNLNSMCTHEISAAASRNNDCYIHVNNCSAGYDAIPAFIMKQCINEYITTLTYLYLMREFFPMN